ncbi:MAG TPA: ectonucleotide pyrophosphatase/phosphodiesterase [Holophagaceae bacterium]
MRATALLALASALLPLWSQVPSPTPSQPPRVLFISEDGLGADQFRPDTMPKLWALAESGRHGAMLPPFPATTFNGHATLATGCWPEHHGVVANAYVDPTTHRLVRAASRAEDLQREPLWVAATRSGVRTAVYHWVGGTGPWQGVSPWRLEPFSQGHPDAEGLAFCDSALAGGARLVMAYLSGTDEEGHLHGPGSPEVKAKLKQLDDSLAPWLTRLEATYPGLRIILTADHGMAPMRKRISLPALLEGIPCGMVSHGGSAYLYLRSGSDAGQAATRLRKDGLTVWTRAEVPARYHLAGNPRVGDLVVLAPEGTWLSQARTPREAEREQHGRAGAHAYGSEVPSMHAWLVVLGAGRGSIEEVPAWDLAPSIAHVLGIHWAQPPDGRILPWM